MIEEIISFNPPLVLAIIAMITVQAFKFVYSWFRQGRPDFKRLVGTGGMPSAHAATVTALSTSVALQEGLNSTLFGVVAFFSLIVMYDATGVRRAAGKQAQILNRMLEDLKGYHKLEPVRLKELIGHTPREVFVGAAYGFLIAITLNP